jgi:uncharacterized membrane protein YkoI
MIHMRLTKTMRAALLLSAAALLQPAATAARAQDGCLTQDEIREEVAQRRVVTQVTALRVARSHIGGEAVRARLCRGENGLVYVITALKRDGKVIRVLVDAQSGKLVDGL